ncbi:polysaccharide biosynthesis/export family protein [Niabella ginsengisoli]|uniref:Polysaccharide biosynthesis/export family protein n=1 Tax=Niabella ginsengisoli TaxID=522298 RepID=A0ABS9SK21_9BACT|nr:polysaccharide biosynthesis/export family protein [Niabella ginsengisoli]
MTTLNPEYNQLFNSGAVSQSLITSQGANSGAINSVNSNNFDVTRNGFQVDENGAVNLPILGKQNLAGLTRKEAQDMLTTEVAKTAKDPIVNVKFLNYKVTVIGEVTRPGSFTIPDERVNVLEALGMAGDMTPFSVRDSVLVIREKDGVRSMQRINLNDKNVFNSPYFYLQQNDVVYVQPENKLKSRQAGGDNLRVWSMVLTGISVLSLALFRFIE